MRILHTPAGDAMKALAQIMTQKQLQELRTAAWLEPNTNVEVSTHGIDEIKSHWLTVLSASAVRRTVGNERAISLLFR